MSSKEGVAESHPNFVVYHWRRCWRDLTTNAPTDIWFDTPRWPDSTVASFFLVFGRLLSLCLYTVLVFWLLAYSDAPGPAGTKSFWFRWFEITNWNCWMGFFLYSWFTIRQYWLMADSVKLAKIGSTQAG